MSWIVDIFTSGGLGSIVGLAGGIASKFTELKAKKAEYDFKVQMGKISLQESKMEHDHELAIADKQMQRAQIEGDLKVEAAEVGAFTESIKSAHKVTGFMRFVRPAITAYVLIACSVLFGVVWASVDGLKAYSPEELKLLLSDMIKAAIFLTVTCTSWWFASRGGNISK